MFGEAYGVFGEGGCQTEGGGYSGGGSWLKAHAINSVGDQQCFPSKICCKDVLHCLRDCCQDHRQVEHHVEKLVLQSFVS